MIINNNNTILSYKKKLIIIIYYFFLRPRYIDKQPKLISNLGQPQYCSDAVVSAAKRKLVGNIQLHQMTCRLICGGIAEGIAAMAMPRFHCRRMEMFWFRATATSQAPAVGFSGKLTGKSDSLYCQSQKAPWLNVCGSITI